MPNEENLKALAAYSVYKRSANGIGALVANVLAWNEAVNIAVTYHEHTRIIMDELPRPCCAGKLYLDDDTSILLGEGGWVDLEGGFIEYRSSASSRKSENKTPQFSAMIYPFDRIKCARLEPDFLVLAARAKFGLKSALDEISPSCDAWQEINAALSALSNLPVKTEGRFSTAPVIRDSSALFSVS